MGVNIITRNLPDDKIDFDKEVVKLVKSKEALAATDNLFRVLSIYNSSNPDAQFTYYRFEGIRNNYFRKAASCNNITFTENDFIYAEVADIHYEIPEGGVPQLNVLKYQPTDDQIGGIIAPTFYTVHLASGKCCYRDGMETKENGRWVESLTILREDMAYNTWVKFKDDEKFYLMVSSAKVDVKTLAAEVQSCRRNRYSLQVVTGPVRPIMPVTWLKTGSSISTDSTVPSKRAHHAVVFSTSKGNDGFYSDIRNRMGEGYQIGKLVNVIATDDEVWLGLETGSGDLCRIQTTFDKLEGGWNLRTDLHSHKRSFWEFFVAFTLEEDVRKAEEEKKRATAPETVIWSVEKPAKAVVTGTYVTAIAIPAQVQADYRKTQLEDNVRNHMSMMEQYIPGLTWKEVEEVRGNFDVIVRGSVIPGTAGAKEMLAKQMNGNINTVLVGILTL